MPLAVNYLLLQMLKGRNSGIVVKEPTEKDDIKHDERLMRMLVSDKKVFDFFFRIVEPARRFYVREAKTKQKKSLSSTNPLTH